MKYRAININIPPEMVKQVGIWKVIWGTDIWINDTPMIKLFALANFLIWIIIIATT